MKRDIYKGMNRRHRTKCPACGAEFDNRLVGETCKTAGGFGPPFKLCKGRLAKRPF